MVRGSSRAAREYVRGTAPVAQSKCHASPDTVEEERVRDMRCFIGSDVYVRPCTPFQVVFDLAEKIPPQVPVLPGLSKAEVLSVQHLAAAFSVSGLHMLQQLSYS